MTVKNKKILILVFLTGCVLLGYWLWLSLRPVAVVAVHDNGNYSYVLVRNFPLTDREKGELKGAIMDGKLPKFDRFQDNFNGMGITVHDTWATHITLKSLQVDHDRYRAVVHYKVQDHFGLDVDDISKFKFNQFRFFRIWFVLQRYNQFGFKPFMTNMEATIKITGDRK
ncbi:DUF3289 family protein [Rosenbergiella sp. S61]|uniref:DUF3289 family protein n=1 Tax=Rosenbergiella gaditana TaxID=2726987 RepID=A0ABS5SV29_9GAMM|nr:YPO3983 family protein [Rosenbergiella gaditana]MBT0723952.1 DUF3289 family protein [Rosenbergiella gaditana]